MVKNNWQIKTLGEVCETTSGGTPSRGNKAYYNGSIPWVKSGELNKGIIYDTEEKITEEAIKNSSAKIFPKGTLLIALYGATIGKLAFLGVDAATNQAVCGIYQNEAIESKYLYNFLFLKKQDLVKQGIGGAQPNISQTILKKLEIPLPPLETQRLIVSKIEELFSELDKGIEDLKTAQLQLKTYRQSVLKWAFEGCKHHNNLKRLKDITSKIGSGSTPKGGSDSYFDSGIPLVRSLNIHFESIKYKGLAFIDNKQAEKLKNVVINEDDVLLNITGASIGRVNIAPREFHNGRVNQHVSIIRPKNNSFLSKYLKYFIQTSEIQNWISNANYGVTRQALTKSMLENMEIPLPSLEEQHRIVQEIESRLSVADKMEESIAQSLQQAEALRQSILKKAFSGELV